VPGLRFYLDENVDVRIADGLRRRGVGASTAHDAGMLGATDAAQLEDAGRRGAVLVTCDHHFLGLAARLSGHGKRHAGVIFVGSTQRRIGECVRRLALCAQMLDPSELVDRIEYL